MNVFETIERQKAQVAEFMDAMGQNPTVDLQLGLVIEEGEELLEAAFLLSSDPSIDRMVDFLKEVADFTYVMIGGIVVAERIVAAGGVVDAGANGPFAAIMVELVEGIMHDATSVFLDDDMIVEAFDRVHASNMSKLGEDGKPIFNEEGKVMKGSFYLKPSLGDIAVVALERLLMAEGYKDLAA